MTDAAVLTKDTKTQEAAYDTVPFESYPYGMTRPENLCTLGTLFGMKPAKIETARVLELGCAAGGNIIPLAAFYPKATFVGIDLSKKQINDGLSCINKMGLKNIELKHLSITDIDKNFGEFDYIVCHGVISWVPDFVREKIFAICQNNLSKNGIAYISYNTLPGWNMIRTIREMMMYHAKNFSDAKEKVLQARLLLNFVRDSFKNADTAYSKLISQEAELLAKQNDSYLAHDHLEDENKQYYFDEFMKEASAHDLQYLCDVSLHSMYVGNMPKEVAEQLKTISNDIIRTEQYMDFLTNRRFRTTLLCHKSAQINRSLTFDMIKNFAVSGSFTPEQPLAEIDIEKVEAIKFFYNSSAEQHISSTHPAVKAILYTLSENVNNPLKYQDLVKLSQDKLSSQNYKDAVEPQALANLLTLVLQGIITLSLKAGERDKANLEKPELTKIARYQLDYLPSNWLTNKQHSPISIGAVEKIILKNMDGKHTKEELIALLSKEVANNVLTINDKEGKKIEDESAIKKELGAILDSTIKKLHLNLLLA